MTYLMPGMVRDVSAMLVATMIFCRSAGANTDCWAFADRRA
jgi:hypothetical protein